MYVRVKVTAGAKKERVTQESEHVFAMSVKEPAERNLANKRVRAVLAEQYGVAEKTVRIITGHRSPGKVFDVPDKNAR